MHDYIMSNYNIDLKNRTFELFAEDKQRKCTCRFFAKDVLTHLFQTILEDNIISDIYESDIQNFIEENIYELEEKKKECWPINYENIEDLKEYLYENKYKYIKIRCSYGLQGWMLAKDFYVD